MYLSRLNLHLSPNKRPLIESTYRLDVPRSDIQATDKISLFVAHGLVRAGTSERESIASHFARQLRKLADRVSIIIILEGIGAAPFRSPSSYPPRGGTGKVRLLGIYTFFFSSLALRYEPSTRRRDIIAGVKTKDDVHS